MYRRVPGAIFPSPPSAANMCPEYPSIIQGSIAVASERFARHCSNPKPNGSILYVREPTSVLLKFRVGFPLPIPIIRVKTVVHFVVQEQVVGYQQEE